MEFKKVIGDLPPEWATDLIPDIRSMLEDEQTSLVVLDDDPTGTQTVYGIPVLTKWTYEILSNELSQGTPLFYILTNSRRYFEKDAVRLAMEVGSNLKQASEQTNRKIRVISRSDSTLRGHYPAEVDALAEAFGKKAALRIIMPFFYEGGRFTINDIHYVKEGENLVPAGETSFARDASFGYKSSSLREWVEEKTHRAITSDMVKSLSIEDIREGGPDMVAQKLVDMKAQACVVNAVSRRDAEVAALGFLKAESEGKELIYRTAASIVPPLGGLYPKTLLTTDELSLPVTGGSLIIVGSYQPKSTQQLDHLMANSDIEAVRVDVHNLLSQKHPDEIQNAINKINSTMGKGRAAVLFTTREVVEGEDSDTSLEIARKVSDSLVEIIGRIWERPRFIMAKGGITSSDIATESLKIEKARVLGQILPGVPVWKLGPESKFEDLVYIVFPGNVGEVDGMTKVINRLNDGA